MLKAFLQDDRGTETVEWGIMAGLIVGALVGIVAAIGAWVQGRFQELQDDLGA